MKDTKIDETAQGHRRFLLNKSRSSCIFLSKLNKISLIQIPTPRAEEVGRKPDPPGSENVRVPGGRMGDGQAWNWSIHYAIINFKITLQVNELLYGNYEKISLISEIIVEDFYDNLKPKRH